MQDPDKNNIKLFDCSAFSNLKSLPQKKCIINYGRSIQALINVLINSIHRTINAFLKKQDSYQVGNAKQEVTIYSNSGLVLRESTEHFLSSRPWLRVNNCL